MTTETDSLLQPTRSRLKDNHLCFYGCGFEKQDDTQQLKTLKSGLREAIINFLNTRDMDICSLVSPGEWLWHELTEQMQRCAFCIFECVTGNPNAHIELGYALANRLKTIVLIKEGQTLNNDILASIPSDLAGLIQIRFNEPSDLAEKFSAIPKEWYSVKMRLTEPLRQASLLDRTYFEVLLSRNTGDSISFTGLFAEAIRKNVSGVSNNTVAEFLARYDEVLKVIEPTSNKTFEHLEIKVEPNYRKHVAHALLIKLPN